MPDLRLLLETSGRTRLGLAVDGNVAHSRELESTRKHNRLLVPTIGELLQEAGIPYSQLTGVIVGTGPGSYTGLRIGLTAAKGIAYSLNLPLIAVPTFLTIANRSLEVERLDVIADALNRTIYVQRFRNRKPLEDVHIEGFEDWKATLESGTWISGSGVDTFASELPQDRCLEKELREPSVEMLEFVGRTLAPLSRDEMMRLEPLYLRGSSAEEKAKQK